MKIKIDKILIKKISIVIVFSLLVILALTNLLFNFSLNFLNEAFNYSLINLSLVSTLKIASGFFEFLQGFSDIIDRMFNFFLSINFLILFQITILKISNLVAIKIVIVAVFILSFVKPVRMFFLKILVFLLFLNPGLSLYISSVKLLSDNINLELGKNVNLKFEELNNTLNKEELFENSDEQDGKKGFMENAKSFFKDPVKSFVSGTKEKFNQIVTYTSKLLQTVMELTIVYFVNSIIIFFMLPIVYFFSLYIITKKLFLSIIS